MVTDPVRPEFSSTTTTRRVEVCVSIDRWGEWDSIVQDLLVRGGREHPVRADCAYLSVE
jgi:hypothetical protein